MGEAHYKANDEEVKMAHGLITKIGLEELAYVYAIGAKKHGANSWLTDPIKFEKLLGRILGHTRRRVEGEIYDKDDGQMHMASVAWAALAITHYDRLDMWKPR